jgi:flagellar hook-associated protein 1 FlgK
MTVNGLVAAIDGENGVQASITDGIVSIGIHTGEVPTLGSLAFANDDSSVLAAIGINTFFTGSTAGSIDVNSTLASSKDYIAAAQIDSSTGEFATGDNTNALAIADLQYASRDITEHSYNRDPDIGNTPGMVSGTIEEYYHSLVGALGIKASSVERSVSFSQTMLHELKTMKESISSVSLDEEMTQLMQYQHAYAAAAKLLSTSDEMLQTLLAAK